MKVNSELFEQATIECSLRHIAPSHPTTIPPPLYGLPVHSGFKCSACDSCASTKHSLRQHKCNEDEYDVLPTSMQQFNLSHQRTWFPVQEVTILPKIKELQDSQLQNAVLAFERFTYEQEDTNDARKISPWLMTTKWHVHSSTVELEVARKVTSLDNPGQYSTLPTILQEYLRIAESRIDTMNTLVLQRLNTDDPQVK